MEGPELQPVELLPQVAAIQVEQVSVPVPVLSATNDDMVRIAGRTALFVHNWRSLTNDIFVLTCVEGIELSFLSEPVQYKLPCDFAMEDCEKVLVDQEIDAMISKGAIFEVDSCEDQFLSNIFLRPKKNGKMRPIINLKKLNKFISTPHFKMEHLLTFLPFIQDMFLTSLDLKVAYFTFPIDPAYRRYLRFLWRGKIYEFQCLCFGLCSAPFIFTKVMKPVFSKLRKEGITSSFYVDDSLYGDRNRDSLVAKTQRAKDLLESLGFVVNSTKSSMVPSKTIVHLGFVIDTERMMISLPPEKLIRLISSCTRLHSKTQVSVRELAQTIGLIVSSFLAIKHGQLHYRELEFLKISCLSQHDDYEQVVELTENVQQDLLWWIRNAETANGRSIPAILGLDEYNLDLFTDASKAGWGAALSLDGNVTAQCSGEWSVGEAEAHINLLELKAIFLGLQSLEQHIVGDVRIHCDNTTAISYGNKYGGCHNTDLNSLSRSIWQWYLERDIMISATHIAGVNNRLADSLSRSFNESVEWSLDTEVFRSLCQIFGTPKTDLFASRLNNKLPIYVSWKPDPGSVACNTFSIKWGVEFGYAFPPFNLIGRVLCKLERDQCTVLLICPYWTSQPWFPHLCSLLVAPPVLLPSCSSLLRCPIRDVPHPLLPHSMQLIACLLSRTPLKPQGSLQLPSTSFLRAGKQAPARAIR